MVWSTSNQTEQSSHNSQYRFIFAQRSDPLYIENLLSFLGLPRSENMWFNKPFRFGSLPRHLDGRLIRIILPEYLSISTHGLRTTFATVRVFLASAGLACIMLKLSAKLGNCSTLDCTDQYIAESALSLRGQFIFDGNVPATVGTNLYVCVNHFVFFPTWFSTTLDWQRNFS